MNDVLSLEFFNPPDGNRTFQPLNSSIPLVIIFDQQSSSNVTAQTLAIGGYLVLVIDPRNIQSVTITLELINLNPKIKEGWLTPIALIFTEHEVSKFQPFLNWLTLVGLSSEALPYLLYHQSNNVPPTHSLDIFRSIISCSGFGEELIPALRYHTEIIFCANCSSRIITTESAVKCGQDLLCLNCAEAAQPRFPARLLAKAVFAHSLNSQLVTALPEPDPWLN